jgi:integrase/recombinase XerD
VSRTAIGKAPIGSHATQEEGFAWRYRTSRTETSASSSSRAGAASSRPAVSCRTKFSTTTASRSSRSGSVRSYAYDLLRWWRWLRAIDIEWDRATSAEVRDLVLWLQQATKQRRTARTTSAATAGTINPITRKLHPGDRYQPRTILHSNAVLRASYEFWIERGAGPLVNPVPLQRRGGQRPNAHHNPLQPFRPEGRLRYNPPAPKRRPRAMSDQQ